MLDQAADDDRIASWLLPLPDDSAPCGPDLEYDNDFLLLTQTAAGKPESQFGPAEPPDWTAVAELSEALLDRSRDLRIAVYWMRAKLHQSGYPGLVSGLKLVTGMIDQLWEPMHPQPDPDDGDPYARVNTLTLLRESDGLIGDLRDAHLIRDRAIGTVSVHDVAVSLGLFPAKAGDAGLSREQIARMLGDAIAQSPALRGQCAQALVLTKQLMALVRDKLGDAGAPDLRPLYALVSGIAGLLPASGAEGAASDAASDDEAADGSAGVASAGAVRASRGLSGQVNSREDAIRAIDMVCAYLERAEPTNPAQLFLKRGRQLVGQNFLQLMKALAPGALSEVAGMVGVDPDSVESPEQN